MFIFFLRISYNNIRKHYEKLSSLIRLRIQEVIVTETYLDPKIVGEAIAYFRKQKRVSQEVLSGLSAIGRTHLSAIERGERKPTLETLYRISCALNVNMSEIVQEIENRL